MVKSTLTDKSQCCCRRLLICLVIMSVVASSRSTIIDGDFYANRFARNQLFGRMEFIPTNPYYRSFPKRSTLIWNPLVIALQKALKPGSDRNKETHVGSPNFVPSKNMEQISGPNGKVYWRCYFNAVSCFTKK